MRLSKAALALLCSLTIPSLVGCAALRASGAKHAYIEKQVKSYTYDQPLSVVWPQARQLLFAQAYEVKDTDASNAETAWKISSGRRTRFLVSGIAVSDKTCQVQFMKADQQKKPDGGYYEADTERDLGMEWELLKKVSPDKAHKIEAEAQKEGDKAAAQ